MWKKFGLASLIIVIGFTGYLIYQNTFVSHFDVDKVLAMENDNEKILLLTAQEQDISFTKKGFSSLIEELRFWEYDEENQKVKLKEESLLPTSSTSILFVYNKANNSLERQENIIPVTTFPYSVHQNNTSFDIYNVDSKGNVYLVFQGKQMVIEPGEKFYDVWFDGLRIRNIKIENFGLFGINQFETF